MNFSLSSIKSLLLFAIVFFLPFFEGSETATGLFLVHTLVLLLAAVLLFSAAQISIPRFLIFFLPFFLSAVVSFFIAPYKFAAFLKMWDLCVATIFIVVIFSMVKADTGEGRFSNLFAIFIALTGGLFLSLLVSDNHRLLRIHGSFVNPNDFAVYCLLTLVLGLHLFEHESRSRQRRVLVALMVLLIALVALSSSRATFLAGAAFALLYIRRAKRPVFLIVSILAALALAGSLIYYRFSRYPDQYSYYRLRIWKHSLQGVLGDPYLGVGLNMLPLRAPRFNFPADTEVGRYARIARSADNQFLQLLAETGFLGFFTFLIGWLAIFYYLRKAPEQFRTLSDSFAIVSIVALFSLPLENTAVLFLFLFLILLPIAFIQTPKHAVFAPRALARISGVSLLGFLYVLAVWLPFAADYEFHASAKSPTSELAKEHLDRAVYLNPFQPYYKFAFVKRVVDSKADLEPNRFLFLIHTIDESIVLNPLEPDFYLYRARIYRKLYDQTQQYVYYSDAISSYQAAVENSPYNVFMRTEYATFSARLGRYDLAASELQKILEAEPAFLQARLIYVRILLTQNQNSEAKRQLEIFDQYYNRLRNNVLENESPYVRNLLTVDKDVLDEVRSRVNSPS